MKYQGETITINGVKTTQVNKRKARKIYESGKTVYLNACNMRVNNVWTSPMPSSNESGEKFEAMVNGFEYYNCCNERGKYANFFVEI